MDGGDPADPPGPLGQTHSGLRKGWRRWVSVTRCRQVSDLKPQFVTCREPAFWAGPSGTAVWSTQCLLGLESPHCRGLAGHRPRLWCGCLGFLPAWGTQSGQPTSLVTPAVGRSRSRRPGTSRLPHSAGQSVPTQIQGGFDSTAPRGSCQMALPALETSRPPH